MNLEIKTKIFYPLVNELNVKILLIRRLVKVIPDQSIHGMFQYPA